MITVNDGYYDFFRKWWAYYEKLDLKLDVLVLAEDDVVFKKLTALHLQRTKVQRSPLAIGEKDYTSTVRNTGNWYQIVQPIF